MRVWSMVRVSVVAVVVIARERQWQRGKDAFEIGRVRERAQREGQV